MIVRELLTKIGFNVDQSKIRQADQAVNGLTTRLNGVADAAIGAGMRLSAFATLPIGFLFKNIIKGASDAAETASKFAVVFKDVSEEAIAVQQDLEKNYGLSTTAAQELLSNTGDLLTGFGFNGKAALDLSQKTNQLAVDLASFTNVEGGAKVASQALTKALLGEREALKQLGVSIAEADIKAKILQLRQEGMTFETERQAKAYAALEIAMDQSKNAIGDYARTKNELANRARLLSARIENLSDKFGDLLIPITEKAVTILLEVVEYFDSLSKETKTTILGILGVVAVVGPLLLIFGALIKSILFIASAFQVIKFRAFINGMMSVVTWTKSTALGLRAMGAAAMWAQAKLFLIPLAIFALIIAVAAGAQALWNWLDENVDLLDLLEKAWEGLKDFIPDIVKDAFAKAFEIAKTIGNKIKGFFGFGDDEEDKKVTLQTTEDVTRRLSPEEKEARQKRLEQIGRSINTQSYGAGMLTPSTTSEISRINSSTMNANKNVNVNSEVVVNVPPGTKEAQAEFVRQAAQASFREEYNRELEKVLFENPELE